MAISFHTPHYVWILQSNLYIMNRGGPKTFIRYVRYSLWRGSASLRKVGTWKVIRYVKLWLSISFAAVRTTLVSVRSTEDVLFRTSDNKTSQYSRAKLDIRRIFATSEIFSAPLGRAACELSNMTGSISYRCPEWGQVVSPYLVLSWSQVRPHWESPLAWIVLIWRAGRVVFDG